MTLDFIVYSMPADMIRLYSKLDDKIFLPMSLVGVDLLSYPFNI